MQSRLARGAAFSVMVGLAACCPTIWVQVNKGDPVPWPPVGHTTAAADPLLIPSQKPNRFDVFPTKGKDGSIIYQGLRTTFAPDFTDTFYPGQDESDVQQRAFLALREILNTYQGGPSGISAPSPRTFSAHLVCLGPSDHGADANCTYLTTDTTPPLLPDDVGPSSPVMAMVNGTFTLIVGVDPPPHDQPKGPYLLQVIDPIAPDQGLSAQVTLDDFGLSTTMLSFVHLSDIQLRDPSVTLTDPALSAQLDWFEPLKSFQYDTDLEVYNQYLVQAVFETMNAISLSDKLSEADRPKFVIHTGDSVDSGSMSELVRFHALIDRLRIPFYELFGNHDVLVFGNLTPSDTIADDTACTPISSLLHKTSLNWLAPDKLCVYSQVVCPGCIGTEAELIARPSQNPSAYSRGLRKRDDEAMVATRERFMTQMTHASDALLAEPVPDVRGDYCPDTKPRVRFDAYTRSHGFDMGTVNDDMTKQPLGYYAFVQKLATRTGEPERNAVFVGLDSEELLDNQGTIQGRVGSEQFLWLRRVLQCVHDSHPKDLVFVFAHQPLGSIDVDTDDPKDAGHHVLSETLAASPNVVGFFFGHNHWNQICGDNRSDPHGARETCAHFWEVETASLVEFPQEGRLVRIKQASPSLAYLEVDTLRERLADGSSDLAKYTALARQGAERDYCHNNPSPTCKTYKRPLRTDGRDTYARLFFKLPGP